MTQPPDDSIDEADLATPSFGRIEARRLGLSVWLKTQHASRSLTLIYTIFLITLGGAIGTNLRYFISQWVGQRLGTTFPYGTLLINITGSFLLGLIYTSLLRTNIPAAPSLRLFLGVGMMGGYTTFSSFSYETCQLLIAGNNFHGLLNSLFSILGGILACFAGIAVSVALTSSG